MSRNHCLCGSPKDSGAKRCRDCYIKEIGNRWTEDDIRLLKQAYKTSPHSAKTRTRKFPQALLKRHSRQQCIKRAHALGISTAAKYRVQVHNINSEDLNYLAGFWDGDGSIYIVNRPILKFSNCDLKVLKWVKKTIGTGVVSQKPTAPSHTKPHYDYTLARACDLYSFLPKLLLHCKITYKQERIKEAIKWLEKHFPVLRQKP